MRKAALEPLVFLGATLQLLLLLPQDAEAARLRSSPPPLFMQYSQIPDRKEYALPTCSCDCCQVTRRSPSEIMDPAVYLKCARNEAAGEDSETALRAASTNSGEVHATEARCWRRCAVPRGSVLTATLSGGTDANRFCHYQCKPYTYTAGDPCVGLTEEELDRAAHSDGNGQDHMMQPKTAPAGGGGSGEVRSADAEPTTTTLGPCVERSPCIRTLINKAGSSIWDLLTKAKEEAARAREVSDEVER